MSKCIVLFVEGDTELDFYKKLLKEVKPLCKNGRFKGTIETKNVKGVGNFKSGAIRKFKFEILPNHKNCDFIVFLCSDTDVFEFSPQPPFEWKDVINDLKEAGATKVIQIQAKHSIEDWFLLDYEGIAKFLGLPKKTKIPKGNNGYEKMKKLYSLANNMYYKGMKSNGMIEKLNVKKIVENPSVNQELKTLYDELGVVGKDQTPRKQKRR